MSAALAPAYLLDTNICVRALRDPACRIAWRIDQAASGTLALSAISHAELIVGAQRGGAGALARLAAFVERVPVAPFDATAARAFARAQRARGKYDRLIAGHALALDATLVTHNLRDFRDVPGLRIEDWTV